jgi:tetratricopeptide (TPR) repeat protein
LTLPPKHILWREFLFIFTLKVFFMLPKPGAALLLITCLLGCHQRHEKSGAVGVVQSVSSLMADANKGSLPVKDRLDAARKADSLTAAINDDVRHLESHKAVARLYLGLDSDRLAKTYLLETAELARRLSDNTAMGKAVNNIGIIYDRKGLNDSALKYYLEANKIFYQNRDSLYAAKALVNIGTIYLNQSKLKEAFEVTLDAIKELQLLNAKKDLASAYLTMGNVLKISNSGQALHYHKMALQVFRDSSDSVGMAISLNNIGNVYRYRKEYAEAISNYQQSLAIKESKGSKKSIGIAADNIGQAFLELGDFGNAEAYFKRAIDIQTATGDDDNLLMSINRLSNLYLQINDLNRAESTALVAQNERPAASQLKQRMDNNWVLFEVYNRLGKDKAASGYARKAFELKDSLYNSDAAAAIARMEAEY